ncbi:MAG: carboxypeptidase-like regulatory domain-containing protein, partial [Methanomicrobiales archaeon]|nr:carboxypeptidase-like regulatory domain-containing protein [Methanomicrobiales archaeon]
MRNLARIVVAVLLAMVSIAGIEGAASAAPPAGSISGTVYRADATSPVSLATVAAYDYDSGTLVGQAYVSGFDGSYAILGLGSGNYRVMTRADGYFTEYYNNVANSGSATSVSVTDPHDTTGINFTLTECGSISGSIYSDNGTPIYSGHIMLFDSVTCEKVDETWMTSTDCAYRVGHDLPSGSYLVRVE